MATSVPEHGDHGHWSSRYAFMLAAVGSAVGLGNIWKFPYEAGQGGGGAFVLIYLAFVFLIGTPILIAELSLGRRGQLSPIGSMTKIAREEGRSRLWSLIGWSGVVGGFLVLSFYSVIGGWTFAYVIEAATGNLNGITAEGAGALFGGLLNDETKMLFGHALFMGVTVFIVAGGVEGGLERAVTFLMPALFALLIFMVIYSASTGDIGAALSFLFAPDFSKLTPSVALEAMGQSFFSLSLALGSIMTYGSYLTRNVSIGSSAVTIAAADTGVALLAGLAIFPIVFAYGIEPGSGPGLIFASLPIAFGQMPLGDIIGTVFFALLAVAAITSAISLLEPAVSYVCEQVDMTRETVTVWMGLAVFLLGIASALSQGDSGLFAFTIFGRGILDALDFLTNNLMMPLGGLFIALFTGWFISRKAMLDELAMEEKWFRIWYFLIRFVCPVAVAAVFLNVAGIGFGS